MARNHLGLNGIEFVELTSPDPESLRRLLFALGFSRIARHGEKEIDHFAQNDIHFLLNREPGSYAENFQRHHGPSLSSMGWRVADARRALEIAVSRGATAAGAGDLVDRNGEHVPAIYGVGGSLIYLVEEGGAPDTYHRLGFKNLAEPELVPPKGFLAIDHLTNNVHKGTMLAWAGFYKNIFGFTEVRYFDIRGVKTGLQSYALRSPCGSFCIPINEATESQSQINEFIDEYHGPGVQHLAFLTNDILSSIEALDGSSIQTLDIESEYYDSIFDRVPNVTEDKEKIRRLKVLVDGDEKGYLLQIFTKNLIGPIFIELIQRKNHASFGEGNFGALFRSIERDQMRRGAIAVTE